MRKLLYPIKKICLSNIGERSLRLYSGVAVLGIMLFANAADAQHTIPANGSDTSTACAGILRDPGGTGNYPNNASGTFVIDPPGNSTVSLTFTQFYTMYADYVYLYDGVGTSGTYLGRYYGTSLPNGGTAFTSTSGALTVQFASGYSGFASGFQATWTTNSSSAPNASFAAGSTSPAYNSPVQFINTSTNGGNYLWEFGDGSTSTDPNPTHAYTISGQHQVRLIASNCSGSDTSAYTTVTVQNPPVGSVSTDTVSISVACGSSNSGSFTISNSGTGNLSYDLSLNQGQANLIFDEEFDNSSLGAFVLPSSTSMTTSFATGAPQGSRYLSLNGYSSSSYPLEASFADTEPNSLKYWIKSDTYASYHGYFQLGEKDQYGYFNNIFYSVFRYNDLRIYYGQNNYTNVQSLSYTRGDWVKVELRNIDFASGTYDIYVDDVAVVTGAEFIFPVSTVNNIRIYNSSNATVGVDDVELSSLNLLGNISYNPTSGNLSNGSNNVVFINADASDLMAGTYWLDFELESNDTALDGLIIPLELEVTGTAQLYQNQTCIGFGSVFNNHPAVDSVLIWNTGCDTLELSNISSTTSDLSFLNAPFVLGKDDSLYVKVELDASASGSYNDTISISGPDTTFSLCVSAQSTLAPEITTDSASYNVYSIGCNDSIPFDFKIYNTGGGNLDWQISGGPLVVDDFESGLDAAVWSYFTSSVTVTQTCFVNSGTEALLMTGTGSRIAETQFFNMTAGDSIVFWVHAGISGGGSSCESPDNFSENLQVEYSTDGSSWSTLGTVPYSTSPGFYNFAIPVSGQVKVRFYQQSNSGASFDHYMIDDFSIKSGNSIASGYNPSSGSLTAGDSVSVSGYLDVSGLLSGTYNRTIKVSSNDPDEPFYDVPVTITVQGSPAVVAEGSCLAYGPVIVGSSASDSAMVTNQGCDNLLINNTTVTNSDFSINTPITTVAPGDTTYIYVTYAPSSIGSVSDTVYLVTNDTTAAICLSATGQGAPDVAMDTSLISRTINGCGDSVLVQRTIYNNGQGPLDFEVGGSAGGNSLQEVLDTFRNHHPAIIGHISNAYPFLHGVTGVDISDGGGDMYDGGNRLNTNLSSSIYYSNDLVTASTAFGTNGQYFTYKGNSIWLFAADIDGISTFSITGNLGADGSGTVSATTLSSTVGGVSYTGFVKRVYNAGDPSINHLIIVENDPSITRTHLTSTSSENHQIHGLSNATRIFYLLYAGTSGAFIDDATTQSVMDEFLNMLPSAGLAKWVSVAPDSAQVAASDSIVLDIWVKSNGLQSGIHNTEIIVGTNDPSNPTVTVPVQLTVNGAPDISLINNSGCVSFGSTQQGATATDEIWLYNSGCDTLEITGFNAGTADFGIANVPQSVAPGDSLSLEITFSPTGVGSFSDTLQVLNNDTTAFICVDGTSVGAPVLGLPTDTLRVQLNKCQVIKNVNFRLDNTGQGAMNYGIDFGGYTGASQIPFSGTSASTSHTFTGVPPSDTLEVRVILHGDFGDYYERAQLSIDGSYQSYVYDNNKLDYTNDTLEYLYYGFSVQNWTSDGQLTVDLNNSYDVDGASPSFHRVEVKLSSQVNWVSVIGSTSGTVSQGGHANKNMLFNAASLTLGTYYTNMNIVTNAPGSPSVVIPVELEVVSKPEIAVSDTCLNYSQTIVGDTSSMDFWLYNRGCQPLNISNILSTNNDFKLSASNGTIAVDDSMKVTVDFVPSGINNYSASLLVNNNDTDRVICLNATSNMAPIADFEFSYENFCLGEVMFINKSLHGSSVLWNFGDGNTSSQNDPVHHYSKAGTYTVMLRVSNSAGFDTITQKVTVKPLHVDFVMSPDDTIAPNTTVSFYDSSAVPISWDWNFGDGNTSTAQNPTNTYSNLGKYEVTLEVSDSAGCTRTETKNLWVVDEFAVEEHNLDGKAYQMYPNPSEGVVNLESADIEWSLYEMSVIDATGRLVRKFRASENTPTVQVDLTGVAPGVYQLVISNISTGSMKGRENLIIH